MVNGSEREHQQVLLAQEQQWQGKFCCLVSGQLQRALASSANIYRACVPHTTLALMPVVIL